MCDLDPDSYGYCSTRRDVIAENYFGYIMTMNFTWIYENLF